MRPRFVQFLAEALGFGAFVPDYDVLMAVAVVIGAHWVVRRAEANGLDPGRTFRASLVIAATAFVAGRLYVVLEKFDRFVDAPLEVFQVWNGGTSSVGVYAGGALAAVVATRWQRLPLGRFLDCCALPLAAGVAIGRTACFLNGCCYGRVTDVPWAVRFPGGSGPQGAHLAAGLIVPGEPSLPVHPTQLYEAVYAVVLLLVLVRAQRRPRRDGQLLMLFFVLYPAGRFVNEFFRGDPRATVAVLSLPQVFCIGAVALSLALLVRARRRGLAARAEVPA